MKMQAHAIRFTGKAAILTAILMLVHPAGAIDNGIGALPPLGWRSWNQFQCNINQKVIEAQYEALARKRTLPGYDKPTSLVDVGYVHAGIDDCWQKCNSGPGGQGFHNASGYPVVDRSLFPDMNNMTAYARSLGVIPGWYGNNCHCRDTYCGSEKCFQGDVQATVDFGFESIKLDGCGVEKNITLFSQLFNATGKHVMLENCHNGNPTYPYRGPDGKVVCPMNFFRSSTDIRPTYGSVLSNLESTMQYNAPKLTGPGCWAYPDMLEVGVTNTQRPGLPPLNEQEIRSHFGAWCVVSAPLVLGLDMTDEKTLDSVLPVITNKEALSISQAWHGDAGTMVDCSNTNLTFYHCSWSDNQCQHPSWTVWKKDLSDDSVGVIAMNNANSTADVTVDFSKAFPACVSSPCNVRDVWNHRDLGSFKGTFKASSITPHDSALLIVSK